jgi:hypothetical protein
MISNFLLAQELEILAVEFDQPVCFVEFRRLTRPTLLDKVSPETYRSVFRVSEVLRIARQVAEEGGVEEPLRTLLLTKPKPEPEEW